MIVGLSGPAKSHPLLFDWQTTNLSEGRESEHACQNKRSVMKSRLRANLPESSGDAVCLEWTAFLRINRTGHESLAGSE